MDKDKGYKPHRGKNWRKDDGYRWSTGDQRCGTFVGAAPPVADENKKQWGYKPQQTWKQGWWSSSSQEWSAAVWYQDYLQHGTFGAAPVADKGCEPQQTLSQSSSSQHWPAREDQETNTEAEAATSEDKEVNTEPAISQNTVGIEASREDQGTNTKAKAATFEDKEVNTEPAMSHKNVGTEDNDLGRHVGFAQTTAGAGEKPWLLKNCFGSIRTRSDKSWRRNDGNEGTFGIFQ